MTYKKFELRKIKDADVEGGFYYEIYDPSGRFITNAWTLSNAKEFVYSYIVNGNYHWEVLC